MVRFPGSGAGKGSKRRDVQLELFDKHFDQIDWGRKKEEKDVQGTRDSENKNND